MGWCLCTMLLLIEDCFTGCSILPVFVQIVQACSSSIWIFCTAPRFSVTFKADLSLGKLPCFIAFSASFGLFSFLGLFQTCIEFVLAPFLILVFFLAWESSIVYVLGFTALKLGRWNFAKLLINTDPHHLD